MNSKPTHEDLEETFPELPDGAEVNWKGTVYVLSVVLIGYQGDKELTKREWKLKPKSHLSILAAKRLQRTNDVRVGLG